MSASGLWQERLRSDAQADVVGLRMAARSCLIKRLPGTRKGKQASASAGKRCAYAFLSPLPPGGGAEGAGKKERTYPLQSQHRPHPAMGLPQNPARSFLNFTIEAGCTYIMWPAS